MIEFGKEPRWSVYVRDDLESELAEFRTDGTTVSTLGLHKFGSAELALDVVSESLLGFGRDFLTTLVRYVANGARIYDGQTVACGSWLLRASVGKDDTLFLNELSVCESAFSGTAVNTSNYSQGAEFAISLWASQTEVCIAAGSEFKATSFSDYAWISLDVLSGKYSPQCSREPATAADGFSGWWMLPPAWDRDTSRVKKLHIGHILHELQSVSKFLALSAGFVVDVASSEVVYDQQWAQVGEY